MTLPIEKKRKQNKMQNLQGPLRINNKTVDHLGRCSGQIVRNTSSDVTIEEFDENCDKKTFRPSCFEPKMKSFRTKLQKWQTPYLSALDF